MRAGRPLALLAALALAGGCQAVLGLEEGKPRDDGAGGGTSSTTSSTGGGASSTSSSGGSSSVTTSTASSTGSTSSTSGTGGNGGAGGGSSSASSSSSTGSGGPTCTDGAQNGGETGVDCGGPDCVLCPTVLLLATGAASVVVAGEYHPGGAWLTTTLPATTVEAPGLAFTAAGKGVGLIRNATAQPANPQSDDLVEAVTWSAGVWSAFAAIGGAARTRGRPAVVSVDSTAQAVFHGVDFKHDYAAWSGSQWTPTSDPVGGAATQSFGPSAPDLAVIGADATAVFIDGLNGTNHLTVQDRKAGVWQSKIDLAASAPGASFAISPSIAAVTGGPELLVVYVRASDKQMLWLARTAGSWSMAAPIASALTSDRVALTGLAGGGALLAFRGTDSKLYTSRLAAGAWSAPIKAGGEALLASSPALARGVGVAEAELCFVNTVNVVYHARSLNNAWTTPVQAGAAPGLTQVAIASHP